MAFVYHIHLPEDEGDFEKGYIGFTSKTVEHRYKEHKALAIKGEPYAIYNAIRKYGDVLKVTTLVEGSNEYCLFIENKLRPEPNMSWNIAVGGGAPMLGKKHSEETKKKFRASKTEEYRKRLSDLHKAIPIWEHGSSDPIVWASAQEVYECYLAHNKEIGPVLLARAFNLSKKKLEAMLSEFRGGWCPLEDAAWLNWRESKASRITNGWAEGDQLLKAKKAVMTDELRKSRAQGGKNRVWTDEMKSHMRDINVGRTHTEETKQKLSEQRLGKKASDESRKAMSEARTKKPWGVAQRGDGAVHWLKAVEIMTMIHSGMLHAEVLRHYGMDRKSGSLRIIYKKIQAGWNPLEDPNWLEFKATYEESQA